MKIAAGIALAAACLVGLALLLRRDLSPGSAAGPAGSGPLPETSGKSGTPVDRPAAAPAPTLAAPVDPRRLLADLAKALRNSDEKAARAIQKKLHDLLNPPIEDDQNAAVYYLKAIELAKQKPGVLQMKGLDNAVYSAALTGKELTSEQKAALKAWFDANGAAAEEISALLREAGRRSACRFPDEESRSFASLSYACNLLRVSALVQQEAGKTDEASENMLAGFSMARSMRFKPDLLSQMLGCSFDGLALETLQGPVSPAWPKMAAWIEAADPAALRGSYLRALLGEVDGGLTFIFKMKDDPSKIPDEEFRKHLESPLMLQSLAAYVEGFDAFAALAGRPYFETRDDLATLARQHGELAPWYASFSQGTFSSMPGLSAAIARSEAMTSMAKIGLDLERYREKNGGYPATLDALGGSTVRDPFTGQAFGYRREGGGYVLDSPGDGRKPLSWNRRN